MLVLALDTTTRAGSCAVARDGVVLREQATDPARSHDAQLPAALMTLLDQAGLTLSDVDVYAVATGPGSFTGLRVGIAAMQGLAFAAGKPLIGVSAFDAQARIAISDSVGRVPRRGPGERIATWVDAWRGEVYAALYENGREIEPPTVEHPDRLLARCMHHDSRYVFIGDAAAIYQEAIVVALGARARIADPAAPLLAGTLAILATDAVRAGHRPPPHAIRPIYVRRPDAVLTRDARSPR